MQDCVILCNQIPVPRGIRFQHRGFWSMQSDPLTGLSPCPVGKNATRGSAPRVPSAVSLRAEAVAVKVVLLYLTIATHLVHFAGALCLKYARKPP